MIDIMMYPFMTLPDGTEITHSEMKQDGTVKVYMETPDDEKIFRNATCWLPMYRWENHGYTELEMMYLHELVFDNLDLFMKYSQEGGIVDAENP